MMKVEEVVLPRSAATWARSRLEHSTLLAGQLYGRMMPESTTVSVPWPKELPVASSRQYDAGGKFGFAGKTDFSPEVWLAEQLASRGECWVLQSLYTAADEVMPAGPLERFRSAQGRSTFVLTKAGNVEDFVRSYMLSGLGQHSLLVIARKADGGYQLPDGEVSAFLPIYDGEAFAKLIVD